MGMVRDLWSRMRRGFASRKSAPEARKDGKASDLPKVAFSVSTNCLDGINVPSEMLDLFELVLLKGNLHLINHCSDLRNISGCRCNWIS